MGLIGELAGESCVTNLFLDCLAAEAPPLPSSVTLCNPAACCARDFFAARLPFGHHTISNAVQ